MLLPLALGAQSWAPGGLKPAGEIGTERFWAASMNVQVVATGHVQRTRRSSAFRTAVREAHVSIDKFLNAEDRAAQLGSIELMTPREGSVAPTPGTLKPEDIFVLGRCSRPRSPCSRFIIVGHVPSS